MEEENKEKVGFFFGAGAEICYGLPSGAEFAFKVLKQNEEILTPAKSEFEYFVKNEKGKKEAFSKVSKEDLQEILESMVQNRKEEIIKKIKDSDTNDTVLFDNFDNVDLPKFSVLKKSIDKFGKDFPDDYNKKNKEKKELEKKNKIEVLIQFNIDLSLFLCGNSLKNQLNNKVKDCFSDRWVNSSMDFFQTNKSFILNFSDEVFGKQDGENAIKLEGEYLELENLTNDILNACIDYQKLFEKFDAAFYPERNKTQFKKIVSLLFVMRQVILNGENKITNISDIESYYKDIKSSLKNDYVVCSSNYSKIAEKVLEKKEIFHLNGELDSFFDLKEKSLKKELHSENNPNENKIYVPFIFPQVNMKPIMYFDVVKLYSDAFCQLKKCSKIAIIGFGLNKDDNLLNGMFKSLLENDEKTEIYYFKYSEDGKDISESEKSDVVKILGLSSKEEKRFHVQPVDKNRMTGDKNWLEFLFKTNSKE